MTHNPPYPRDEKYLKLSEIVGICQNIVRKCLKMSENCFMGTYDWNILIYIANHPSGKVFSKVLYQSKKYSTEDRRKMMSLYKKKKETIEYSII